MLLELFVYVGVLLICMEVVLVEGFEVCEECMCINFDLLGGLILLEWVMFVLVG